MSGTYLNIIAGVYKGRECAYRIAQQDRVWLRVRNCGFVTDAGSYEIIQASGRVIIYSLVNWIDFIFTCEYLLTGEYRTCLFRGAGEFLTAVVIFCSRHASASDIGTFKIYPMQRSKCL